MIERKGYKYGFFLVYMIKSKKGVLILFLLLTMSFVSAQNESIEDMAISCLKDKVEDKCSSLSFQEQVFSLLSIGKCKSELKDKGDECFPSSNCNIKDTSLALLALENSGSNTDDIEEWLLDNRIPTSEVEWFLEIDLTGQSQCTLTSDDSEKTITISEDKKISGNPGSCFSFAYDSYWLKVDEDCFNKKIQVSCDKDFISTLLYKKQGSNIWHVSNDVESASAEGKTEHKVNSLCFSTSSSCDYESNLWASLALSKVGKKENITSTIPYLVALEQDYEEIFPESFLYILTNSEDYLTEIGKLQETQGFWELGDNKFYDTALAILSLPESGTKDKSISWLAEVQDSAGDNKGCWNSGNIRDTGFILWAGWPSESGGVSPSSDRDYCDDFDYYCMSQGKCDEAGGEALDFVCSGLDVCCSEPQQEKTCFEQGGKECSSGEICDGTTVSTSDVSDCCLGNCVLETTECEQSGYYCRSECLSYEESVVLDCSGTDICCKEKADDEKSYWWIYLLIILIILVVLGIIFRNKLRRLLYKFKNKFKSGGVSKSRPNYPGPPGPPTLRRTIPPRGRRPTPPPQRTTKPKGKTDKDFEDTLKKLKDMAR